MGILENVPLPQAVLLLPASPETELRFLAAGMCQARLGLLGWAECILPPINALVSLPCQVSDAQIQNVQPMCQDAAPLSGVRVASDHTPGVSLYEGSTLLQY